MKNLKEDIAEPRIIALYMSLTGNFTYTGEIRYTNHDEHYDPLPEGTRREVPHEGAVRVSEPVELRFVGIGEKEMVVNAIASLDEQERKLYRELNDKLAALKDRKNQLLALTHQPE